MSFWGELKRRNVFKVGAAYAIVAWLLVQICATVFQVYQMPVWTVTFITTILIVGFPIALLFAWAFELTPDGIKKTERVPLEESITHVTGKKLDYMLGGLLLIAVAYILFDNLYLDRRVIVETEVATVATQEVSPIADVEEAPKKSIAVLPFSDLSPEKDQEYFVDGLSEELLNCLAKINSLRVTSRTSSFAFKNTDKTLQEIAGVLGVDHILEGSVRKAGDKLRIAAQLIRVKDDSHLWSNTYDRELKDIFEIQEEIAKAVADELKITLGIEPSFRALGGTDNTEAYEKYLIAQGLWQGKISQGDIIPTANRALESLDAALSLDPEFALAWSSKAIIHIFLTVAGPSNRIDEERNAGQLAAGRAIELEPDLAAGYYALGYLKTTDGDFIPGGIAYRQALELTDRSMSFIMPVIAIHYLTTGYFQKAREYLEALLQNDPLNTGARAFYLFDLGLLGDIQREKEEMALDRSIFGNQWDGNWHITLSRIGKGESLSRDEILYSDSVFDAFKEHLESPKEGLSALQSLYHGSEAMSATEFQVISLCAAYFGDHEFAMDAMLEAISINAESICLSYFPVMREVRKLPRYKELIREIGLVDYWNEFGWPDICRQLDDGDFECD